MLSRHNIRIKAFQSLYAQSRDNAQTPLEVERYFLRLVQDSYRLYLYTMYLMERVGEYNQRDVQIKQNKYLPSEEDLKTSLCLYDNPIIRMMRESADWQNLIRRENLHVLVDGDKVRGWYQDFVKTDYYKTYAAMENPPLSEHQYALVNLYKHLSSLEVFTDHLEDHFPMYEEDESLVYGAVKRCLRQMPEDKRFFDSMRPNEEFVQDFGKELIYQCLHQEEMLSGLIVPKLENWKEDRVAVVDMLLIKMALCEFMYFPSIPTKVSLDEYLNLAKDYSTDKSKRFINGILDRLMKQLQEEGRISKDNRGMAEA